MQEHEFDLIQERWILVRTLDGKPDMVGLSELFRRARQLRAVEDASPLVVASLYRLLLAIVHRAIQGPLGLSDVQRLLEQGCFSPAVEQYLEKYSSRFFLFGPEPFFQVGDLKLKSTSIAKLAVERSSGNNKALFDHSLDDQPPAISYAEAARWLVAHQAFSLCGGVAGGGLMNFTDAPSPRGALVFVLGENLFQTLVANLVWYTDEEDVEEDTPSWEEPAVTYETLQKGQVRSLQGDVCPVRLYTWQSRAIRLIPEDGLVRTIMYTSGFQAKGVFRDPALAYQKPRKGDADRIPVRFSLEKAFWRDFQALVPPNADLMPQILRQVNHDELRPYLVPRGELRLQILGQVARPGKPVVDAWNNEVYPLPLSVLADEQKRIKIGQATQLAEDIGKALRGAGYVLARELSDAELAGDVLDNLPLMRVYWSRLEVEFTHFLSGLGRADDPEVPYREWTQNLVDTAWQAYNLTRRAIGNSALERRAVLMGEDKLHRELLTLGLKTQEVKT
ncbi:type I-E CRISPR-associated protein Cse1/CasA [Meiothermus sp.]|uniref:type I-E CRISPR-associated protein Cse1/CasA n=1 Tax=Meiothermus sp. TaxID=1955249 RepID=UPI002610A508|nr:type I-E CRISPR-associated protein Cse1/CasA [Meiothermus sp.]